MNADGFDDFIVGSPEADGAAGSDTGKAYVIQGSPVAGGSEKLLAEVGQTIAGVVIEGAAAGDQLGASVGGGFDVNADGVADGLAGAPFADSAQGTPTNAGETYVISPVHPREVLGLRLEKLGGANVRLEWSVPPGATAYNVYRGTLTGGLSSMVAVACGILTDGDGDQLPDTTDATSPTLGNLLIYLVTAQSFLGEGPLGASNGAPPRVIGSPCP
jgi:hypothetical protein